MKTLLRSCFLADPTDREPLALQNYHAMVESGLGFDQTEDTVVWQFIQDFFKGHGHIPTLQSIRTHYERVAEMDVVDRLERVALLKPRTRGDFITYLENKASDRRTKIVLDLAKDMAKIASTGIEVKDGKNTIKLQGAIDAIRYALDKSHDIVAPTLGSKLSGNVMTDEDDFNSRYDKVKADPMYGVGQWCGISQIDSTLNGAKRYELWLHTAFTGGLKCVTGGTEIWDVSSGHMRTVKDIYESGDLPQVHGLDESTGRVQVASVSHVVQQGVRPIWKVKSEYGKEIRVSGNHPFLTPKGWVNAENLQSEEWVAVPSKLKNDISSSPFTDDEVEVLGYLLGDGCIKNDISLSNGNPGVLARFMGCLSRLGYRFAEEEQRYPAQAHYRVAYRRENCVGIRVSRSKGDTHHPWQSHLRLLLERLGLYGTTAGTKFVPSEMWAMTDEQVWTFLSALWSTDGRVGIDEPRENRKARPSLWITLKSKKLVEGISRLLQRVGVPSSVRPVKVKYNGETLTFWQTDIRTNRGQQRFLEKTEIFGKEVAVAECLHVLKALPDNGGWCPSELLEGVEDSCRARTRTGAWHYAKWAKRKTKINQDTFERLANASGDPRLITQAQGDICWERVRVERDGEEMTYDLSVPGIHNFVANGFITHNSTFALHWAYIQAVYFGNSSIYFSLEMPYIQCRNLLYTMHSAHEDFREIRAQLGITGKGLDYEKIRDGELNANEEKFLKQYVVPSMNKTPTCEHKGSKYSLNPQDYGDIHIEVSDPDKTDFNIADLRSRAELIFAKTPFKLIFLDHVGLMSARGRYGNTTDKLNEVIRDLKRLAMSFNRGMGIAVVGLFQISREGFRSAEKNGGRYNLTHLSYANEAERCVISSTYVRTPQGLVTIGEVRSGGKVWSSTGWRTVQERFDNGVRRVWAVTTDRGSRIEATAPHRVRVVEDGQLGWCAVEDLSKGQYVAGTFGGNSWPKGKEPRLLSLAFRKNEARKGRKGEGLLSTPGRITTELAYLLGSWDGDGKIHSGGVAWTSNRKEKHIRAALESCFKATFHHSLPGTTSPSRPGVFDLTKWSLPLKRWFETVAGPRAGEVPAAVLGGSQSIVCAYLKGLFDTDGWINRNGIIGINLKASCEPFLRDIQMLLTSLGIDSHLGFSTTYSKQTCKYHSKATLRVRTREGRVCFNQLIGFTEPKRKRRAASFIKTGKRSQRRGDIQVYAVPETALRVYRLVHPKGAKQTKYPRSFYNLPSRIRRTGTVPRHALVQLVNAATDCGYENPDIAFLRKLLSLHVMKVVSVEDTGVDAPVMDLEVGGDCEYQTGPVLSHNSSDIVTAAYIDDDLRKLGRVIFQCLKSRDQAPFDRISVRVEFSCRRMLTDNTAVEEIDEKIKANKGQYDKVKPIEHPVQDLIE